MSNGTVSYRGKLPHLLRDGATYFVTFNLHGAIPEEKRRAMEEHFARYESLLHLPDCEHWLRDERLAQVVHDKLIWLRDEVELMQAFTVMSNHVHLMMTLKPGQDLRKLLQLVKGSTSRECNLLLRRFGKFWQRESFERIVRGNEYWRIIHYILNNPVKAGLVQHWRDYRWTYTDPEHERLALEDEASRLSAFGSESAS